MLYQRANNFHTLWDSYLARLLALREGRRHDLELRDHYTVSPRGIPTYEVLGAILRVDDLQNNILVNTARDLNYRFMVAEFLWIAFGHNEVDIIAKYNKEIAKFSDDGKVFYGSYGTRLKEQWPRILSGFKKDLVTRQAVSIIFNPDMNQETKDTPCTISLQWILRGGRLNCIATMRSSDIWLGLPYDFYNFSQLTNCLAGEVGANPGWLQMQLGSLHLYESNASRALDCNNWTSFTLRSPRMRGFPDPKLDQILLDPHNPYIPDWTDDETDDTFAAEMIMTAVLRQQTKVQALGVLKDAQEAIA